MVWDPFWSCSVRFVLSLSVPNVVQATPSADLSQADIEALTTRTQDGGTEVVQAKAGKVRCL